MSNVSTLPRHLTVVRRRSAGGERCHYHDLRARRVGKLMRECLTASELTGHATAATAERISDQRIAKWTKPVHFVEKFPRL